MKKIRKGILLSAALILLQSFEGYGAYSSVSSGIKITSGAVVINDQTGTGGSLVTGEAAKALADGTRLNIDNVEVEIVQGPASKAGIPAGDLKTIASINKGESLSNVITDIKLSGYKALLQTSTISVKDKTTNTEIKTDIIISFYVPNLIESLKEVQVLFYDRASGKWIVISPDGIDYKNKKLSVKVTGSGVFTVLYRSDMN